MGHSQDSHKQLENNTLYERFNMEGKKFDAAFKSGKALSLPLQCCVWGNKERFLKKIVNLTDTVYRWTSLIVSVLLFCRSHKSPAWRSWVLTSPCVLKEKSEEHISEPERKSQFYR